MNKATILVSAVLGICIGMSIGIAQASDTPVSAPVEFEVTAEVTEEIFFMEEVTIVGARPALHAANRGPSKPAKKQYCQVEDLQQGNGSVRYCFWK